MQLSYDYAKDRALMCLRANYESHLIYAFKKLAGNARKFQMFMEMPLQEFEFLLVRVERLCPEEERKRLSKRAQMRADMVLCDTCLSAYADWPVCFLS